MNSCHPCEFYQSNNILNTLTVRVVCQRETGFSIGFAGAVLTFDPKCREQKKAFFSLSKAIYRMQSISMRKTFKYNLLDMSVSGLGDLVLLNCHPFAPQRLDDVTAFNWLNSIASR